tara:strand:+ start:8452 stop:10797 length:2346 start_codon:yes stop_codon:yes gene_type:complete
MHPRLVAGVVVLWACVAIAATSWDASHRDSGREHVLAEAALAQSQPSRAVQGQKAVKPFKHSEHVNRAWQSLAIDEVFRDCRGCHQFSPQNAHSTPQAECDSCHQGAGKLQRQFDKGWQNDLSAYATRTSPAFRHYTHGMLECRQCHHDEVGLFAHMPVRTGPAFCAECHEKTVTAADVNKFKWLKGTQDAAFAKAVGLQGAFTEPTDAAAYAKQLDLVFAGTTGGINTIALPSGGDFDHADHINTGVGAEQGLACAACHTNIRTAGATEVGTGVIPTDGCKTCHIRDAAGAAAAAAKGNKQTDPQPLWSLGTFAHADHFGFLQPDGKRKDKTSSAQAYTDIENQQCAACHTYAPVNPGISARDFPFDGKASKHTYSDCVQCHTVEGWQTGEQQGSTKNPPLHTSNGGTGWRECAACHELGKPDMAGLRPTESVQRWSERTFVFEGQTHPHITTKGVERGQANGDPSLQKDCATCHRAVVPALPTRLIEKAFTHKTHLSANPTQQDCAACHETAQSAANSLALSGTDYRTYSLKSCSTCHWGGDVVEQVVAKEQPKQRAVVAFPHGPHVQAGQSCSECHEPAADGRDMVTLPAALACNQCHKHEAVGGARPTERLLANEVASCIRCHHEDQGGQQVASVPPAKGSEAAESDDRYVATQTVFAGFAQSQFHPAGSDCTKCHTRKDKRGKFASIRVPTGKSHLSASANLGVHADVARGGFGKNAPADCLRCHWKPVGKWADAVGISSGDPAAKAFRAKPGSPATRERFGNLFRGYPGSKEADG